MSKFLLTIFSFLENTQTENKSIPPNVTSPFRRSLLWPPELGPKKKKHKNQNISVATTEEWIYIHEKEAEEKKKKLENQI